MSSIFLQVEFDKTEIIDMLQRERQIHEKPVVTQGHMEACIYFCRSLKMTHVQELIIWCADKGTCVSKVVSMY